jgi:hypothetical protein
MFALPMLIYVGEDGSVEVTAGQIESVDELVDLVDTHLGIQL